MALIKCVECNSEFSDQATACPKCGCPKEVSLKAIKDQIIAEHTVGKTCNKCGSSDLIGTEFSNGKIIIACNDCWEIQEQIYLSPEMRDPPKPATPECPYCHSHDTKKIGSGGRTLSLLTLGLAGSKIGKQRHCKHCGSDF